MHKNWIEELTRIVHWFFDIGEGHDPYVSLCYASSLAFGNLNITVTFISGSTQ